jgi:hypothetical protein
MEKTELTETEARTIVEGFQTGSVDEIDLLGMIEDLTDWIASSDSSTASRIREERRRASEKKAGGWYIEPIGFVRSDDEYGPFADVIEASEAMDEQDLSDLHYKIVQRS